MPEVESIGRYRIQRKLGAGAFATVHKAYDDDLQASVAIKVLSAQHAADPEVRRRFLEEARLLRRIRDDRVVRVYDIGSLPDGRPYFVMDYCDAGSFAELRRTRIAPGRVLRLCAEAGRGLEVLHRHNMIHRDVTPANVLMSHTPTGTQVVLADLGVAKSLVERTDETMTVGTPAYMALEQATGAMIDQRADVYSLAAVTYTLLAGSTPYNVRTLDDLVGRNPAIGPAPIADRLGAPPLLDELLQAALSANPDDRPPTAEVFARALDAIADVMPGGETHQPLPLDTATPTSLPPLGPPSPLPLRGTQTSSPSLGTLDPAESTHWRETPASMLDNYLGQGTYRPAPAKERHSALFWVWAVVATAALLALVAWVTTRVLGS